MDGKQLKNSILQWAIQGKLVPQNPKDEPAQKLLERIAASRNGDEPCHPERSAKGTKSKDLKKKKSAPSSRIYRENGVWYEQAGNAAPKDISDEIPFEIPENWAWTNINSIAGIVTDGEHLTPQRVDSFQGFYLLSARNILDGKISLDSVDYVDQSEYNRIANRCNPSRNDILISCSGSVGRVAVVNDDNCYVMVRSAAMIRVVELDSYYLMYALQSPCLQEQIQSKSKQTAQANLFQAAIRSLFIPIPPLAEQKRIVAKLEQVLPLAEEYGTAQEQLDKLNKELPEALKKSILQEAIQGKLVPQNPKDEPASVLLEKIRKEKQELVEQGKLKKKDLVIDPITKEELSFALPEKWEICRLGDLCYLVDGEKTSLTEILLDAKYLRGKSSAEKIQGGRFVKKGDNIILVDGENSGEVFEVPIDGIMGSTFKQIIVNKTMYKPYVMIQILAYKDLLRNSKKGAAIPHLNKDIFRNLPIGIPPISEQKRIVAKLEQLFKVL
ncbi:restriction endonuclease subunit S [Fibrobacter sp. UBA2449]|uniref:restriction endonuclease subunit S n=1 Tax=Fibrobacter sp. UBA2449 TaxID=1946529 RepID=UPI0025BBE809|nr:restriction endonuclease subunit S [Fibrobacter sp. UBA2449]